MRRLPRWQYGAYLKTGEWNRQRRRAVARARRQCSHCCKVEGEVFGPHRKKTRLEVHHITYARLGFEEPEDVIVLCEGCHDALHNRDLLVWDPEAIRRYLPEDRDAA